MKFAEPLLLVCVAALAGFIGSQTLQSQRTDVQREAAGAIAAPLPAESSFGTATPEVSTVAERTPASTTPRSLDPRELRVRLTNGALGTYIDDLVNARDSAITRWPDRLSAPLRVWIAEAEDVPGWNSDFMPAVRDAFETWVHVGVPVHFTFVVDSSTADVHVGFVERFDNGISGKTTWSRNAAYWLVSSEITLGVAHPTGGPVSPPQMRAIALHEVGHLLGLDHSRDLDNIMSARIRVRDLTEADRATVRLLYSVPAGSVK
jgi:Matrixin